MPSGYIGDESELLQMTKLGLLLATKLLAVLKARALANRHDYQQRKKMTDFRDVKVCVEKMKAAGRTFSPELETLCTVDSLKTLVAAAYAQQGGPDTIEAFLDNLQETKFPFSDALASK
jgi:hypothetical protein